MTTPPGTADEDGHAAGPRERWTRPENAAFLTVTFCTPLPDVPPYVADLEHVRDAAVAELRRGEAGGAAGVRTRSPRCSR
ncbi:hypothetical protein ABZV60_06235 [Streptomyces sp. NPDC004787]|uniref:hypothetical protein n=1 Tax=Streptomyces sp. NPDC004787 TaxID=3154291 RepID=UPI0033B1D92D